MGFCQDLPAAFQELIYLRKQRAGGGKSPLKDAEASLAIFESVEVDIDLSDEAPKQQPAPAGLGWSPFAAKGAGSVGRAVSMPAMAMSEGERPPPDFAPLIAKLTGPDAAQRARALADMARTPEASARALAERFPGPSAWSRMPVEELPEADELGPIPGALARLGRPGALALAPLLDSDNSDTRYLALLTAGNTPFPELVDGILRGLFDLEPDISSAARAAATAYRRVPRFDAALRGLRQELASRDALRRSLAARALGVLHDREAVDGLIGLTGSVDQMTAQAAGEALREITRQSFGTDARGWTRWWAENRGRRRIEWLVSALRQPDVTLRQAAIEELSRAINDALGFDAGAEADVREASVRRWEHLIHQPGRWEKFDIL
jgi:HEAT repeat protein